MKVLFYPIEHLRWPDSPACGELEGPPYHPLAAADKRGVAAALCAGRS